MLKSDKLWKNALQDQHWAQGKGGGRLEEEIYNICVFVPFILSGIVWKFGSVDFVDFWSFDFRIFCLHEAVAVTFKGK